MFDSICFYHSGDLDGHCAGAVVHYFTHADCCGVDYGDSLPFDVLAHDDYTTVYVVDFSFTTKEMHYLAKNYNLVWIDHHKTNLNLFNELHSNYPSFKWSFALNYAACELAYLFFTAGGGEIPDFVHLLGRYDVWDHDDERVLPFQYGMRLEYNNQKPVDAIWKYLFNYEDGTLLDSIISTGKTVLEYQKSLDEKAIKNAFEVNFHGYKAIAVNVQQVSTYTFAHYQSEYDIGIGFHYQPGRGVVMSLRSLSDDVDVSAIADKYDGGGHKGAAGFVVSTALAKKLLKIKE